MKISALASPLLIATMLAAACGCSAASGPGPAGTPATTSSGAARAGTAATPLAQAAAPQPCRSGTLRIRTAPGSGEAMDGTYWDLTFTNTGTTACTLYGYPGVSFLTPGRTPLTAPAVRAYASPRQVTLAPGQVASAQLKTPNIGNLPKTACHQAAAKLVKVYPPDGTVSVYVPASIGVCAGSGPGGSVWPVVPGNHAGVGS